MEAVPWTGRIIDVTDGDVYLNAGKETNVKSGQRLVVSTVLKELTDPASGAKLGVVKRRLGEIEIQTVRDKFSGARPIAPMQPARGDLVRLLADGAHVDGRSTSVAVKRNGFQDFESASAASATPMLPSGAMSMPTNPFGVAIGRPGTQ